MDCGIFKDLWVLEYSPVQGCFHVELFIKSMVMNRAQVKGERPFAGYIPIFAGSKEDCHKHAESVRDSRVRLAGNDE